MSTLKDKVVITGGGGGIGLAGPLALSAPKRAQAARELAKKVAALPPACRAPRDPSR